MHSASSPPSRRSPSRQRLVGSTHLQPADDGAGPSLTKAAAHYIDDALGTGVRKLGTYRCTGGTGRCDRRAGCWRKGQLGVSRGGEVGEDGNGVRAARFATTVAGSDVRYVLLIENGCAGHRSRPTMPGAGQRPDGHAERGRRLPERRRVPQGPPPDPAQPRRNRPQFIGPRREGSSRLRQPAYASSPSGNPTNRSQSQRSSASCIAAR